MKNEGHVRGRRAAAPLGVAKAKSFCETAFAATVLVVVLVLVLKSWSSTRSLSFSVNGTWYSKQNEAAVFVCDGDGSWECDCTITLLHYSYSGPFKVCPLNGGGWFWTSSEDEKSPITFYFRHRKITATVMEAWAISPQTLVLERRVDGSSSGVRVLIQRKGKYIIALFGLIGSYKWIQTTALTGTEAARPKGVLRRRIRH